MMHRARTIPLLAVLVASGGAFAQTSPPECHALVSAGSDLYLVSNTGAVITRFTDDGEPKESASLAPNGGRVIYIPSENTQTFTVVDTSGRSVRTTVAQPPLPSVAAFENIAWAGPESTAEAIYHVSPQTNGFTFYTVSHDLSVNRRADLQMLYGQACTLWNGPTGAACIDGNRVDSGQGTLDNEAFYQVDVFAPSAVTQLATFSVVVGMSATTATTPALTVRVESISNGITLHITFDTGVWVEQTVADGGVAPVELNGIHYGFIPKIVDRKQGLLQVALVQSNFGDAVFDPAIAPYGENRIAVIERAPNGPELVLIGAGQGIKSVLSGAIGLPSAVQSMHFLREGDRAQTGDIDAHPSLLVFQTSNEGSSGFGYVPVSIVRNGGQHESLQIGAITSLPSTLSVALAAGNQTASVLDWSCGYPE